jgi:hypothetical protein
MKKQKESPRPQATKQCFSRQEGIMKFQDQLIMARANNDTKLARQIEAIIARLESLKSK